MTQPTIKLGSSGDAVSTWQKVVGVTVDGKFGPATESATKAYQVAHKLTADGVVGPLTWASTTPSAITSMSIFGWITSLPLWSKVAVAVTVLGGVTLGISDRIYTRDRKKW
jgi:peptidoglycan hydrolase-like protein with peptidoglycan-binding domain